jgi:hypothetical protein
MNLCSKYISLLYTKDLAVPFKTGFLGIPEPKTLCFLFGPHVNGGSNGQTAETYILKIHTITI